MKLKQIQLCPYDFKYAHGYRRQGVLLKIENENGDFQEGDLAPLIERSKESLLQSTEQLKLIQDQLLSIEWDKNSFLDQLTGLSLHPSLSFALESALFSFFEPALSCRLDVAALMMGDSAKQILDIAAMRKSEGFTTAKVKIGNLDTQDAFTVINELKGTFKLRVDANSRWSLSDSIRFFSQFPGEIFDYIEDPVDSIQELQNFPFPIGIEEPISKGISFALLETIPKLKAINYKPTVQGGYLTGLRFKQWADARGIELVLSSSLESDVGHFHIVATASRLNLTAPLGIATYHYLTQHQSLPKLHFQDGKVTIL